MSFAFLEVGYFCGKSQSGIARRAKKGGVCGGGGGRSVKNGGKISPRPTRIPAPSAVLAQTLHVFSFSPHFFPPRCLPASPFHRIKP